MTWNYRTLFHSDAEPEPYYAVHEVFYDDEGKPNGWTEDPIDIVAEDEKEIAVILEMMLNDAKRHPVLKIADGKIIA